MHAFLYWTYFGSCPDLSTRPLGKPPIKEGMSGRPDPMPTLWKQKEPSYFLCHLGPCAGQQSLAPEIVDLQQAMCMARNYADDSVNHSKDSTSCRLFLLKDGRHASS